MSAGITDKMVDCFAKQPHVTMAMGVVNQPVEGVTLGVTGIDLEQFNA